MVHLRSANPVREPTDASPRVVIGAANYWGGPITTGSHHYARRFAAAGWDVAYLSDQISPFHLFRLKSRAYTRDKFRLWLKGGVHDLDGRLWAYNHLTLLPVFNAPLLRSRLAVHHAFDLSVPPVTRMLRRKGFERPDLFWVDHLVFADLLDRIRPRRSVYRMADDPERFPEAYPPALLRVLPDLIEHVDLVVVTARRLLEKVRRIRTDGVVYLPNGVDYDRFEGTCGPEPAEYGSIPKPRVIYIGSLEPWFADAWLEAAARDLPDASFVIIGPPRIKVKHLTAYDNVHVLGPKPYARVPAYLDHADVGIIPYRPSPETDAVNSIKLYEYLAAGLPVVATNGDEIRAMDAPVSLVDTADEFVEALGAALDEPGNATMRKAFARANSWTDRFRRFQAALEAR